MILSAGRDLDLRPLRLADARALFALTEANRTRLRRWLPWVDDVQTVEDTKAFIALAKGQARRRLGLHCALWWKGRPVGVVGFNAFDWANRLGSIGYWLAEHAEGHGLMTRAVAALVDHGFETEGLNRIEIRVAVRNHRSRAIPQRLGFRHEGTLHEVENLYGRYVDHALYARLKGECAP